eukprot:m.378624 g.378624  ORF g.378624 m.378624 type:complete len:59 (+) comp94802_c0_seq1:88-264(+)
MLQVTPTSCSRPLICTRTFSFSLPSLLFLPITTISLRVGSSRLPCFVLNHIDMRSTLP